MEEALIKRILPHSIEAEQSVIGSMLMDRDAILVASEILTSDDFYQNQYGIIFDAMVELCNEGQPVDLVTLQNRLKEKDLPPDISSMEYVRELLEAVPTSANIKYYANIVSEKAVLRRLIKAAEEVANSCYLEKESTEMILEESEKDGPVLKLTHDQIARYMGSAREVVSRMLRYFTSEGIVRVSRGTVEVTDKKKLRSLAGREK